MSKKEPQVKLGLHTSLPRKFVKKTIELTNKKTNNELTDIAAF